MSQGQEDQEKVEVPQSSGQTNGKNSLVPPGQEPLLAGQSRLAELQPSKTSPSPSPAAY